MWIQDHWFLLLLFTLYTLVLAYHAWMGRRRTASLEDFYVGGRNLGGISVGLSFFATFSSTNSFVGFAGQGYFYGVPWLLLTPFIVGCCLITWVWIAPRLRSFTESLSSLTLPDFLGFRFASTGVRFQAALIVIVASFFYMTAIFKGIGNLLEAFLEIPYWLAIVIVFLIVMTYTAVGGFISVVKTDVVQGVLLVFAALFLFEGTVRASGGMRSFFEVRQLPEGAQLFSWDAAMPFPLLVGILFAGAMKMLVEPRQLSRFYALASPAAVRQGMWVATLAFVLVYSLIVPIGIYARRILPGGIVESDRVVPMLLTDPTIFHPLLSSFMLLAMIAAAMSSLDSVLLVMAATCQRDLVGVLIPPRSESSAVRNTKVYVAFFALVTTVLALNPPGGIVKLTVFSGSLYAACFFPALVFGLYWRRGNAAAVMASFAVGISCLLVWERIGLWPVIHEVFPSMLLSCLAFVLVALFTRSCASPEVSRLFSNPPDDRSS